MTGLCKSEVLYILDSCTFCKSNQVYQVIKILKELKKTHTNQKFS